MEPSREAEIPITPEEQAAWLMIHGSIMTVTRDGKTYRVVDPYEVYPDEEPPSR